jgi:hypothetical protein
LELGDYFKLTWTRGPSIGGPYASTVFKCESITYAPNDDSVEISAVWCDDTQTEQQYLLDDETMLVRSKGGLTGSADGHDTYTVAFGGTIDLATMGVVAGDILILRDSTQADDVFTRNAAFRITSTTPTTATVTGPTGLPSIPAGAVINADWSIIRGATTYPTAISDPTNYPSGGVMYGKTTDSSGVHSDSTAGNRLISG